MVAVLTGLDGNLLHSGHLLGDLDWAWGFEDRLGLKQRLKCLLSYQLAFSFLDSERDDRSTDLNGFRLVKVKFNNTVVGQDQGTKLGKIIF